MQLRFPAPRESSHGNALTPDQPSGSTGRTCTRVGTSNCFACHPVTVATPSGGARRSNPEPEASLEPFLRWRPTGTRPGIRKGAEQGLTYCVAQARHSTLRRVGPLRGGRWVGAGPARDSGSRSRGGEGG